MRGTCENFCPEAEIKLRTEERLLHFFELKPGTKQPGTLVKCFSRSAAGVTAPKPKDLRTEEALHKTIEYLFKNILQDKRRNYSFVYDFIFDRLRAVRQEIVIQQFDAKQSIALLQPMILYLAYSRFNLCEEPIETFDAKICEHHLQECLKRVLCCYDQLPVENMQATELKNCILMESLYQIFNLGSTHTLRRAISLSASIRESQLFKLSFDMSRYYFNGQLFHALKIYPLLPHILCALASLKLPQIRYKMLHIFAFAYNSKQLTVPLSFLSRCLQHTHKSQTIAECTFYGLSVKQNEHVLFNKSDFQSDKMFALKKEHIALEKLATVNLPDLLLLRDIDNFEMKFNNMKI